MQASTTKAFLAFSIIGSVTLLPLLAGISIAILGMLILSNTDSYLWYFVGGCCMGFSWAFCLPFIQSLLASLDRKGSSIAAGSAFSTSKLKAAVG